MSISKRGPPPGETSADGARDTRVRMGPNDEPHCRDHPHEGRTEAPAHEQQHHRDPEQQPAIAARAAVAERPPAQSHRDQHGDRSGDPKVRDERHRRLTAQHIKGRHMGPRLDDQ